MENKDRVIFWWGVLRTVWPLSIKENGVGFDVRKNLLHLKTMVNILILLKRRRISTLGLRNNGFHTNQWIY